MYSLTKEPCLDMRQERESTGSLEMYPWWESVHIEGDASRISAHPLRIGIRLYPEQPHWQRLPARRHNHAASGFSAHHLYPLLRDPPWNEIVKRGLLHYKSIPSGTNMHAAHPNLLTAEWNRHTCPMPNSPTRSREPDKELLGVNSPLEVLGWGNLLNLTSLAWQRIGYSR